MTTALALANAATTYTKTEVDNARAPKATTAYVGGQLATKANQATTYTITQVDTALARKANQTTTYTKTEVDT